MEDGKSAVCQKVDVQLNAVACVSRGMEGLQAVFRDIPAIETPVGLAVIAELWEPLVAGAAPEGQQEEQKQKDKNDCCV